MTSCVILSWASVKPQERPMWLPGIMKQYSKKAKPQLMRMSFTHSFAGVSCPGLRKKPYQAKVITMLLITSREMVSRIFMPC